MNGDNKKYREKKWISLNNLADFIAEFNKDGKYNKTAWQLWYWLDKRSRIAQRSRTLPR